MQNNIKKIEIKNFKSIKRAVIEQCNRINLFIGRPNVGKSNILEALSLFSLPHSKYNTNKKLSNFVRLENEAELFFDGNVEKTIEIKTNITNCQATYSNGNEIKTPHTNNKSNSARHLKIDLQSFQGEKMYFTVDEKLNIKTTTKGDHFSAIKKYIFLPNVKYNKVHSSYLIPPYGSNLLNVIELNKKLKEELLDIFSEYGLKLVFDKASQSLKIMKESKGKDIFLLPYSSIADTLQRIIFFKTAIASNEDSVLLFEEPEAHSFPPYIVHITQEIIHSLNNQFFISTHSPYIVNDFLENCREDLSIFIVDYKSGETKIKGLSKEEMFDIYQNGVDLFANNERYL